MEIVIRSCAQLMLVTQSDFGNKSHWIDLIGDFFTCTLSEIVRDNTLQTWHPMSLYRSSNTKITSDVLRESLNSSSFKDCWHLCIERDVLADSVIARSEERALSARTLDRGFESRLRNGCLSSSFYVVLSCVGRGLAMSWSLVQGVLPYVEID
jgi:hypothetical protein